MRGRPASASVSRSSRGGTSGAEIFMIMMQLIEMEPTALPTAIGRQALRINDLSQSFSSGRHLQATCRCKASISTLHTHGGRPCCWVTAGWHGWDVVVRLEHNDFSLLHRRLSRHLNVHESCCASGCRSYPWGTVSTLNFGMKLRKAHPCELV